MRIVWLPVERRYLRPVMNEKSDIAVYVRFPIRYLCDLPLQAKILLLVMLHLYINSCNFIFYLCVLSGCIDSHPIPPIRSVRTIGQTTLRISHNDVSFNDYS